MSRRSALRAWVPLAAVGGLLAAVAVAATTSAPQVTMLPHKPPAGGERVDISGTPLVPTGQPTGGLGEPPVQMPGWIASLFTILCIGTVVLVIGWLLWYFLRDWLTTRAIGPVRESEPPNQLESPLAAVRSALDEGLVDLDDTDADPRRAVIACWLRLEQAAAAAGTPRQVGDTSTDLVLRLLGEHRVSAAALDGFAAVYRAARYGQHTVDESMRDLARAALRQLRNELAEEARAE